VNIDAKTLGFTFLKPGRGSVFSSPASRIVSPTGAPFMFLIPATRYPTSPADRKSFLTFFGENIPNSSTL
jgi:hypothetical protein